MSARVELMWFDRSGVEHSQKFDDLEQMTMHPSGDLTNLRVVGWVNGVRKTIEVEGVRLRDYKIMVKWSE